MATIIYSDEQRTITQSGDTLYIALQTGNRLVRLPAVTRDVDAEEAALLSRCGVDPAGYYAIARPNKRRPVAILSPETRKAVEAAIADAANGL